MQHIPYTDEEFEELIIPDMNVRSIPVYGSAEDPYKFFSEKNTQTYPTVSESFLPAKNILNTLAGKQTMMKFYFFQKSDQLIFDKKVLFNVKVNNQSKYKTGKLLTAFGNQAYLISDEDKSHDSVERLIPFNYSDRHYYILGILEFKLTKSI